MALIMEYYDLQQKYEELYGDRTVVAMQEGSFYETYEYDPNNCASESRKVSKYRPGKIYNDHIGLAIEIGVILESDNGPKNKREPYSVHNPNRTGIPVSSWEAKKQKLLANNFIIILVDQVSPEDGYSPETPGIIYTGKGELRKVMGILSPATELDVDPPLIGTNNITSIYIEYATGSQSFEDFVLTCGLSTIDVTTGRCKVSQLYSRRNDNVSAIQEILRFLLAYQPREILINVDNLPGEHIGPVARHGPYAKFLQERLGLDRYPSYTIRCNTVDSEYKRLAYQEQFFRRVFFPETLVKPKPPSSVESVKPNSGLILILKPPSIENQNRIKNVVIPHNVLTRLDLERMDYGRLSLILLLQYCQEHNENTIRQIKPPDTN